MKGVAEGQRFTGARCFTHVVAPLLLYFFCFWLLSWPAMGHFSDRYFADGGDGFQNVWNLWWVNHAVTVLGVNPWFTTHAHFPHGVTLVSHTLNVFNGFVTIGLLPFFTLLQSHNLIVIFSFVMGGWTAFLLGNHLTRKWMGGLITGFVFTFANVHFAHAEGHLQLVSLEWIPLFLFAWLRFLDRPTSMRGIGAASALFLVILCDYYYFLFSVVSAIGLTWRRGTLLGDRWFFFRAEARTGSVVFLLGAAATSGVLVGTLMIQGFLDPFAGSHYAKDFSMDLLGWLIPGGHWRFNEWTRSFWEGQPGNIHENSVHLGFALSSLVAFTAFSLRRERQKAREQAELVARGGRISAGVLGLVDPAIWLKLLLFFMVFALGPCLHVWGHRFNWLKLPYGVAQFAIPPLRLSGCPARMMIIGALFAGLLGAHAWLRLWERKSRVLAIVLIAGTVFEFLPKPIPLTPPPYPGVVFKLKALSKQYGYLDVDDVYGEPGNLFLQTVHEVPMVFGYLARFPKSVMDKRDQFRELIREGRFRQLCEQQGIRYVLVRAGNPRTSELPGPPIFEGEGVVLFDMEANGVKCKAHEAVPNRRVE